MSELSHRNKNDGCMVALELGTPDLVCLAAFPDAKLHYECYRELHGLPWPQDNSRNS